MKKQQLQLIYQIIIVIQRMIHYQLKGIMDKPDYGTSDIVDDKIALKKSYVDTLQYNIRDDSTVTITVYCLREKTHKLLLLMMKRQQMKIH